MRLIQTLVSLAAVGLMASACAASKPTTRPAPADKAGPRVVVTNSILGDLTRNVMGEGADPTVLVPAGADTHTYEPSPADLSALSQADVVIEHGLGYERWLDRIYTSSGSKAQRFVATAGITPLPAEDTGDHHAANGTLGSAEVDPHVWYDVRNAIVMADNVRDALVGANLRQADHYRANAERYRVELEALDRYVVEQTQAVPPARRKLVTSHDTFQYFAKRYGFEIVGTAFGGVTTEAADPSAGQIAALVREIRAAEVPVIFAENVQNPALMQRIAAEAGVRLGPTLYTDALGEPGSTGDTYVKLVRYNVDTIAGALR